MARPLRTFNTRRARPQARRLRARPNCIACTKRLRNGDLYLWDNSGGFLHAACCGPERESYCNADGDPLGPDDPIPTGDVWRDHDPREFDR